MSFRASNVFCAAQKKPQNDLIFQKFATAHTLHCLCLEVIVLRLFLLLLVLLSILLVGANALIIAFLVLFLRNAFVVDASQSIVADIIVNIISMTQLFSTVDFWGDDIAENKRREEEERKRMLQEKEEWDRIQAAREANPEATAKFDAEMEQLEAERIAAEAIAAKARAAWNPPVSLEPFKTPCAPAAAKKKPRATKPRKPRLPKPRQQQEESTSCSISKEELCALIAQQIQALAPPPPLPPQPVVYQMPPMSLMQQMPSNMSVLPLSPPQEVVTPLPIPVASVPVQIPVAAGPQLDSELMKQWHEDTMVQAHKSEFDEEKRWVRPRKLDRRAPTIANVRAIEEKKKCLPGSVYVAVDWMRTCGMVNLHAEWLKKSKNTNSHYSRIQSELVNFFIKMRTSFETQFAEYVAQPEFNHMAYLRKKPDRHSRKGANHGVSDIHDDMDEDFVECDNEETRAPQTDRASLDFEEDTLYVRYPNMPTSNFEQEQQQSFKADAADVSAAAAFADINDDDNNTAVELASVIE